MWLIVLTFSKPELTCKYLKGFWIFTFEYAQCNLQALLYSLLFVLYWIQSHSAEGDISKPDSNCDAAAVWYVSKYKSHQVSQVIGHTVGQHKKGQILLAVSEKSRVCPGTYGAWKKSIRTLLTSHVPWLNYNLFCMGGSTVEVTMSKLICNARPYSFWIQLPQLLHLLPMLWLMKPLP